MLCSKCVQEKDLEDFSFRNRKTKRRHSFCKDCHAQYRKQHYLEHKEKYIKKALRWNRKQRQVLREYLFNVLSRSKCVDCGEKDIVVLDFDHLKDKQFNISLMFRSRYSVEAIEKEIQKCVIRCANCHRKKTAREMNSWKFIKQNIGA